LEQGDLHDPSPTAISLTFSGPINLSNLFVPDTKQTALQVVDSSGHVWPIIAESYDLSSFRLKMVFDQPLPAGTYSLYSNSSDELVDLAGQPISSDLKTLGALASWGVTLRRNPRDSSDLGVLWPASADQAPPIKAGPFRERVALGPGQGIDYRW